MESTRQIAKERIRQGTVFVNDKGGASANPLGIIPQNRLRKSDSDDMQIKNGLSSPGIKIEPGTSYQQNIGNKEGGSGGDAEV